MTDEKILFWVKDFRTKIDNAQKKGCFINTLFEEFPDQCCGIASVLLAEFLYTKGIETLWVSNEEYETHETHAWLVVKDNRISNPHSPFTNFSNGIINLYGLYGGCNTENIRDTTIYYKDDIKGGLIIDITGDQFGECPVYVDYIDSFHKRFDFVSANEHENLVDKELIELYRIIMDQ